MKVESNDQLKEVDMKNCTRNCFDDIIYENILIYSILYKTLISAKPLCIRFGKVDGFIRVYDGNRYLVLFGPEKYDAIYKRIRYLISLKSDITYVISHNYARIKIDSYDSLPLEKTLTLHNVTIFIKSVFNKDRNNCYFNIFLKNVRIN